MVSTSSEEENSANSSGSDNDSQSDSDSMSVSDGDISTTDAGSINKADIKHHTQSASNTKYKTDRGFKLSCLHDWSDKKLTKCLKEYAKQKKDSKKDTRSQLLEVGIVPDSSVSMADMTPWWKDFTKSKHRTPSAYQTAMKISKGKDSDTYESWFNRNTASATNWLAGAGLSQSSSSEMATQKSKVEDIEVPSIYEKSAPAKGRRALKRERKAEREKTVGKKWFDMKAPDLDDKIKNDMDLIRMRDVLDPKRFYKHQDRKAMPRYFQMGTVVDEGTDFYSSRLTKKQRKQTLVQELMADANIRQYNKRKYSELQQKMRGKKKFKTNTKSKKSKSK